LKSNLPPDYKVENLRRIKLCRSIRENPNFAKACKKFYSENPIEWINDFCVTYNPRAKKPLPRLMPFVLFPKQIDMVLWLQDCIRDGEGGLCEKTRDMGATWLCCAFSIWLWLFYDGASIGWGSRKESLVDRIGDPDSIFEKMRMILRYLPDFMLPNGFEIAKHATYMKIVNPVTGATITGESGDNIGRGGRSLMYFKDEALTLNSKILTVEGWKLMGDLNMKDKVIGLNGKSQNITGINDAGEYEIYRVGFSDGTFVECSPNHLWTLNKVLGKKEQVTLRTNELSETYKYITPEKKIMYKFRLPLADAIEFPKEELPLHPYVVGALIGDGGVSQVPHNSPKFTSMDDEVIDYLAKCLPDYCVMKKAARYDYRLNDVRGRMGWKHKSRIRQAILDIGLAGKRAWEKFIPDMYKYSTIEERIELLQGLMDTDGSAGKSGGSCAYYTSSEKLALDVRFLAESLGGYATMKIKKDKRGYRDQYVLFIILPTHIKPFRLSRKLELYKKRKQSIERAVTSVEKTGRVEPVRCISVDSKESLYLTNNCIPTHNCAHYERPELIEAALSDNTDVQIDISSVRGTNNVFYRRRIAGEMWQAGEAMEAGRTKVFIMDWRDHPLKTQEWYDLRRKKAEAEGLLHVFAQEVDRDYSASVDRIIIPAQWVKAAIDAHERLKISDSGDKMLAMDVADEGGDKNAVGIRHGVILKYAEAWGEGDTGYSAKRAIALAQEWGVHEFYYDSIGVGAGVKSETNRLRDAGALPPSMLILPWNAAHSPLNPDDNVIPDDFYSPTNADFFSNIKAQAWWNLRTRFYKTWRMIEHGDAYPHEDLISLDSSMACIHELVMELSQPTQNYNGAGKLVVDKKPDGGKSPNLADCVAMVYTPVREVSILDVLY
jgi:hypothetical protein